MRFLLKIGFWVALIAFFLPSPRGEDGETQGVDAFGAILGTQQALSDASGFCERAPLACEAGRDVGSFVASRVGDGLAYGYAAMRSRTFEPTAEPVGDEAPVSWPVLSTPALSTPIRSEPESPARAKPDPMQTAALAAERVRQAAALEPFAMPAMPAGERRSAAPDPALFVHAGNARAVPVPTPRP